MIVGEKGVEEKAGFVRRLVVNAGSVLEDEDQLGLAEAVSGEVEALKKNGPTEKQVGDVKAALRNGLTEPPLALRRPAA